MTEDIANALLDQAHANYRDFYRALALASPHGSYQEIDGLGLISSGLPLADINLAIATRRPADPTGAVDRATTFFHRFGLPWRLVAPDGIASYVESAAAEAGLATSHPEPVMLLEPIPPTVRVAPPGFTIHQVADSKALREFTSTAAGPLETTPDVFSVLFDRSLLAIPELRLYLAKHAGEPAGTAALFISERIAGVYCVATLPAFRRRGIAAALTWHAVQEGRVAGCEASCLQAWPMAVGLYSRLGYRHAVAYRTWTSPVLG